MDVEPQQPFGPHTADAAVARIPAWLSSALAIIAYVALAVLGVLAGIVQSFSHGWELGPLPLAALMILLVNFGVFRLAGLGMGRKLGAIVPAAGWAVAVTAVASGRPEGDVIVTGTLVGYLFLFGGMIAAAAAVMVTRSPGPPGAWLIGGAAHDPRFSSSARSRADRAPSPDRPG